MKKLVTLLSVLVACQSFACDQQEAQFIGKAKNVKIEAIDQYQVDCTFQLEISELIDSRLCPLNVAELSTARFTDSSCQLKNGDAVSGVIVQKQDKLSIE